MLINMVAERKVKNIVQAIVQRLAVRETINSILTVTNQEQLANIVLIV